MYILESSCFVLVQNIRVNLSLNFRTFIYDDMLFIKKNAIDKIITHFHSFVNCSTIVAINRRNFAVSHLIKYI